MHMQRVRKIIFHFQKFFFSRIFHVKQTVNFARLCERINHSKTNIYSNKYWNRVIVGEQLCYHSTMECSFAVFALLYFLSPHYPLFRTPYLSISLSLSLLRTTIERKKFAWFFTRFAYRLHILLEKSNRMETHSTGNIFRHSSLKDNDIIYAKVICFVYFIAWQSSSRYEISNRYRCVSHWKWLKKCLYMRAYIWGHTAAHSSIVPSCLGLLPFSFFVFPWVDIIIIIVRVWVFVCMWLRLRPYTLLAILRSVHTVAQCLPFACTQIYTIKLESKINFSNEVHTLVAKFAHFETD